MAASTEVLPLGRSTTAYLQPPGGWFLNNAGWMAGRRRVLLIDTCATESRTRHLLHTVRNTHPDTPITAVLTHAHGDHANGAGQITAQGGRVLATSAAAAETNAGPHTYPEIVDCSTWGEITSPDEVSTVDTETTIDLGGDIAEIFPVPTRAHTDGDLVVHQPGDRVLFAGDLVFHGVTPLALHGSITGWIRALDWLAKFDAVTVIPGHGPADRHGTATAAVRGYLRWLLEVTGQTNNPDFDALQQRARALWPDWHDPERHAVNLRVAHAETHEYPFELVPAVEAMLRQAGGPIRPNI